MYITAPTNELYNDYYTFPQKEIPPIHSIDGKTNVLDTNAEQSRFNSIEHQEYKSARENTVSHKTAEINIEKSKSDLEKLVESYKETSEKVNLISEEDKIEVAQNIYQQGVVSQTLSLTGQTNEILKINQNIK